MIMKPMQALPVVLYNRQLPLCEPMIAPFNSVIGVNGHGSELRNEHKPEKCCQRSMLRCGDGSDLAIRGVGGGGDHLVEVSPVDDLPIRDAP